MSVKQNELYYIGHQYTSKAHFNYIFEYLMTSRSAVHFS